LDESSIFEAELKSAIVRLWSREAHLTGYERLKLKSLLLNLKALWLANDRPVNRHLENRCLAALPTVEPIRNVRPVDRPDP
jgi:hypothetical protein